MVFLTALGETGELPLEPLLYSSDSDAEPVCESSSSELEVEYEEDCNP